MALNVNTDRARELFDLLHDAADRVPHAPGDEEMDSLASALGDFLRSSTIQDEFGVTADLDPAQAIGYGGMVGWIARGMEMERGLLDAIRRWPGPLANGVERGAAVEDLAAWIMRTGWARPPQEGPS